MKGIEELKQILAGIGYKPCRLTRAIADEIFPIQPLPEPASLKFYERYKHRNYNTDSIEALISVTGKKLYSVVVKTFYSNLDCCNELYFLSMPTPEVVKSAYEKWYGKALDIGESVKSLELGKENQMTPDVSIVVVAAPLFD